MGVQTQVKGVIGNDPLGSDSSAVQMPVIGSPTYSSLEDIIKLIGSAGTIPGSYISDAGGATIDVAGGSGFIRSADSHTGDLFSFDWSASAGIAIPADVARYIGIEYNAGSPQVVVKTTDTWDEHTDFRLGSVVNEGGTLHLLNNPQIASDGIAHIYHRFYETEPLQRAGRIGGLMLGETGTRNVTVTAGELYDGLNEFAISAIDTSGSDRFDSYYRDSGSGFTKIASQAQWNNTQYDNGSGTLQTLLASKYACQWFYLEADGSLVHVFGRGSYATLAGAQNESPPSNVPLRLQVHGRLIGRIVFQESAATAEDVDSAFEVPFNPTGTQSHLELTNIGTNTHAQIDTHIGLFETGTPSEGDMLVWDSVAGKWEHRQLVYQVGFGVAGSLSTGDDKTGWLHLAENAEVMEVEAFAKTAPTGAAIWLEIEYSTDNGSSWAGSVVTAANLQIAAGSKNGNTTVITTPHMNDGYLLRLNIDQVGSTIAGSDLTVFVRLRRRD
jgi:hypothetical protein